ncbi:hypothetical protein [Cellulomonas sp. APG4]|uniref:hypothetical protein n=1 Tax=Cellulomonas sp. APG4 TaxID=1538656 RepID=UPI00192A4680|nr:hypothetical protein [Cellulomonas sp. APG4]
MHAAQIVAEAAAEGGHLAMPPVGFGVVTLAVLLALLGVTWSFRSVGQRHSPDDHDRHP